MVDQKLCRSRHTQCDSLHLSATDTTSSRPISFTVIHVITGSIIQISILWTFTVSASRQQRPCDGASVRCCACGEIVLHGSF